MRANPLPTAEMAWLRASVEPYMPQPFAMFLGGSRGGLAGAAPLQSSDHDVMLVASQVQQPLSMTLHSPVSGGKFDIILRDPETLAYDFNKAREGGNASLLHLCAFSAILHDEQGMASQLQANTARVYRDGPYGVAVRSLQLALEDAKDDCRTLEQQRDPALFAIANLSLTHRFGWLALRANRQWVARGKVIARFMSQHMPVSKLRLEAASDAAMYGDTSNLRDYADHVLAGYHPSTPDVPVQRIVPIYPQGNVHVGEVYHHARLSSAALKEYLRSETPAVKAAANDWVHYVHGLTGSAVDAERYNRPNGEYRYALARHLNTLMDSACFARDLDPNKCDLRKRLLVLQHDAPDVVAAVDAAQHGQPEALHGAADRLLSRVIGEPQPLQARLSPAHLRHSPVALGLI